MASRYEALREAIGAFDVKIRSLSDLGIDYRRNESAGETTASPAPLNAHKPARYYPALLSVEGPTTGYWVSGLASQLSLTANTLQQGELHNAVQNLAGRVNRKGVAEAARTDLVLGSAAERSGTAAANNRVSATR